jgi:prevent-host-death family protein
MVTNVRAAKARLSELLERAAAGEEIVITSDGRPKAKLVAVAAATKPFRVNRRLLARRSSRKVKGSPAERLVREDRDGRD